MADESDRDISSGAGEEEVRELLERARGGDEAAMPALRRALDANREIWRAYGDLARHARDAWISLLSGPDLALKESVARTVDEMEAELAGPGAPPLERLLAERIVACWLQLQHAQVMTAQSAGASLKHADFALRREESLNRRFLSAVGALATVRRLLPRAVEVLAASTSTSPTGPPSAAPGQSVPAKDDQPRDCQLIPFDSARKTGRRKRSAVGQTTP